jgi:transcriptional regulator with XRE-family HTH domain
MPEIGATLREARMRQRIDISDIEAQTKIRAKYLRALENEEWELLPGPTFVKTFLRTYAEALGLDARLLLEEFKLRYERLSDHDLQPIAPPSRREQRRRRGPSIGRDVLIAALLVALVALLVFLGRDNGDNGQQAGNTVTTRTAATTPKPAPAGSSTTAATTPARKTTVRLRLDPTGPVYVCLKAGDRVLIREQTLTPSTPGRTYRARSFRVLLGNGSLSMRIDGKRRAVAQSSEPVAYVVTPNGRRRVANTPASSFCA